MNHDDKLKKWDEYSKLKNIPISISHPPIDKIIKKLRLEVPPMFFWKFAYLVLANGVTFFLLWGGFMYFIVWRERPIFLIAFSSLIAGSLFGIMMSSFIFYRKRKWKLKSWQEFHGL